MFFVLKIYFGMEESIETSAQMCTFKLIFFGGKGVRSQVSNTEIRASLGCAANWPCLSAVLLKPIGWQPNQRWARGNFF
jgi:hypothetical protein